MSDIVETNNFKNEMSLNGGDVKRVIEHLEIVKKAVSEIMREGIDRDYSVIPGTNKQSLLKPGAEKLMRLFGLGVRFNPMENVFDIVENFAMYSYAAEVYHLKSGTVIAQSEGTANSQEKKYKERKTFTWQNGRKTPTGSESIPVADIVNTLKKMAQKRAMVGAVIIAVGASDYFSQDEDEVQNQQGYSKEPEKESAERFGNNNSNNTDYVFTFGKFQGQKLGDISEKELQSWVDFHTQEGKNPNGKLADAINKAREILR